MLRSFALILAVAACGGSTPEPAKPVAAAASRATAAELVPMCQRIFARKATCADDYLPVLLDLRIELNMPAGHRRRGQVQGRDAVLAIAHTELARDTEPAKVDALCQRAATEATKAPARACRRLLEQGARCEAAADCKAFAVCVVEIDRGFMASGAEPGGRIAPDGGRCATQPQVGMGPPNLEYGVRFMGESTEDGDTSLCWPRRRRHPGMNGQLTICDDGYTMVVLANLDPPAASRIERFALARLPTK